MAYLTSQLITNAYYISGIVSRNLETVDGQQMTDGLSYLNEILSFKSVDTKLIPYFTQSPPITLIPNTEMYFVPNLLEVATITFNDGTLRYQMQREERKKYFGSSRVDNISSLPFSWHMERTVGGSNIFLYFLPQLAYVMKIWGKFALQNVQLFTDLSTLYDAYYIAYLKYATAEYICIENNIAMQAQAQAKLKEYTAKCLDVSPIDLSINKYSTLGKKPGLNWGDITWGRGWRPS